MIDARQARIKVQQLDDIINVMQMQKQAEATGTYIPFCPRVAQRDDISAKRPDASLLSCCLYFIPTDMLSNEDGEAAHGLLEGTLTLIRWSITGTLVGSESLC